MLSSHPAQRFGCVYWHSQQTPCRIRSHWVIARAGRSTSSCVQVNFYFTFHQSSFTTTGRPVRELRGAGCRRHSSRMVPVLFFSDQLSHRLFVVLACIFLFPRRRLTCIPSHLTPFGFYEFSLLHCAPMPSPPALFLTCFTDDFAFTAWLGKWFLFAWCQYGLLVTDYRYRPLGRAGFSAAVAFRSRAMTVILEHVFLQLEFLFRTGEISSRVQFTLTHKVRHTHGNGIVVCVPPPAEPPQNRQPPLYMRTEKISRTWKMSSMDMPPETAERTTDYPAAPPPNPAWPNPVVANARFNRLAVRRHASARFMNFLFGCFAPSDSCPDDIGFGFLRWLSLFLRCCLLTC